MILRPFWNKLTSEGWLLMTCVTLVLAIPRFFFMLRGSYNQVIFVFLFMWACPFIFLSREGRKKIGLVKPKSLVVLPLFFAIGFLASLLVYEIGYVFYSNSNLHWYVKVMNTFNKGDLIAQVKPHVWLFLLFCIPTLLLSPIGEEFFFEEWFKTRLLRSWE